MNDPLQPDPSKNMTPNVEISADMDASTPPASVSASEQKAQWPQWAIVILLTMLIAISGAELLGTVMVELIVDFKAALPHAMLRLVILGSVLIIATFLLVKQWKKLFSDRAGKSDSASTNE